MLITCPNCGTNFSIPDAALGTDGRKLKCAKCGHKWFQAPLLLPIAEDDVLDLDFPVTPPPPPSAPPPPAPPTPPPPAPPAPPAAPPPEDARPEKEEEEEEEKEDAPAPIAAPPRPALSAFPDLEPPPLPSFGARLPPERPAVDLSRGLLDDEPSPVADVFATPRDKGRRAGTAVLWTVLFLLVLGGLGGALYYFQDHVVDLVPEAGDLLAQAGLRQEKPGAGLELRQAGTPERLVINDVDVLVVRGIIANVSDRIRAVPTMKLALLDKAGLPVQEKLSRPPVAALDPQGTASFKILVERPDPTAAKVEVVFIAAPAPALPVAPPPPPPPSSAPAITPPPPPPPPSH